MPDTAIFGSFSVHQLKIRKIGNSLGVTLPREAVAQLRSTEGDMLYLTETPLGFLLTPYDPAFAEAMTAFEEGAKTYRNALHELAP